MKFSLVLKKMLSELTKPVTYKLSFLDGELILNNYIGCKLTLEFLNSISCLNCNKKTRRSFGQGYCYVCFKKLAACDLCVLKPETCHYHLGTCREPSWGDANCMISHIVYLANTGSLKVGLTRNNQIPTRWIDQGATQALPIFRTKTRQVAGFVEVLYKQYVSDKTNWRVMLKGNSESIDLYKQNKFLETNVKFALNGLYEKFGIESIQPFIEDNCMQIEYPVKIFPKKISSHNFDKNPLVEGTLQGIKGQYLLLDTGVLNIRKFTGYHICLTIS